MSRIGNGALRYLRAALSAVVVLSGAAAIAQVPAGYTVARNIPYVPGGGLRQQLDVYYPSTGGPAPTVFWIHGGGWEAGSKDTPPLELLAANRYTLVAINYRFTQTDASPAQIQDCKAAVRFIRANAATYRADPQRVVAWGQSAGANLATLLGTSAGFPEFDVGANLDFSSRVNAVVDFFGPTDLSIYGTSAPGDTLSRYVGATIQSRPDLVARVNPITYADPFDPPFLIMHSINDPTVQIEHSRRLKQALDAQGVPADLREFPNWNAHSLPGALSTYIPTIDAFITANTRFPNQPIPEPKGAAVFATPLLLLLARWRRACAVSPGPRAFRAFRR